MQASLQLASIIISSIQKTNKTNATAHPFLCHPRDRRCGPPAGGESGARGSMRLFI